MEKIQLWNTNHHDMNVWGFIPVGDNWTTQLFSHLQMLLCVYFYFWFLYKKSRLSFITRKLYFEKFPCGSSENYLIPKESLVIICNKFRKAKQSY